MTDGVNTRSLAPFSIRATSQSNAAPTISGTPPATATVGVGYSFQPTARDSNGDSLVFSISNRPAWASFSSSTGRLSGAPAARACRPVLQHHDSRQRRREVDLSAGVLDQSECRTEHEYGAGHQRLARNVHRRRRRLRVPAFGVRREQRSAHFQHYERALVGDLQRVDGPSERRAGRVACRRLLEHRHQSERRQGDGVAACLRHQRHRSEQSRADDQRLAFDGGDRGSVVWFHAVGERCGRRYARLQHPEPSDMGDVQHEHGSVVGRADGCARRLVREHRHQRERRPSDGVAACLHDRRKLAAQRRACHQRLAGDLCQCRRRLHLPSDRIGCERRRVDVLDRESSDVGDVQHEHGSVVGHADRRAGGRLFEHRHQRERRLGRPSRCPRSRSQ